MTDDHKKEMSRRLFGKQLAVGGLAALFGLGVAACSESTSQGYHNPTSSPDTPDDNASNEFNDEEPDTEEGTDEDGEPIEITIDDRILTSVREDGILGFFNGNGQAFATELPVYNGVDDTVVAGVVINDLWGPSQTGDVYHGSHCMSTEDFVKHYMAGKLDTAVQFQIDLYEGLVETFAEHIEGMVGDSDSARTHSEYLLDKLISTYNSGDDQGLTLDENSTVNFAYLQAGMEGVNGALPEDTAALFIPVKVDGDKRMLAVYQNSRSVSAQDHEQTSLFGDSLYTLTQDVLEYANVGFE
ncbi:MAG: hypothetical protein GY861_14110 [bacterium]|nr:hypothetical protein [bacterium]